MPWSGSSQVDLSFLDDEDVDVKQVLLSRLLRTTSLLSALLFSFVVADMFSSSRCGRHEFPMITDSGCSLKR